jgi:hypothetical protein
MTAGLRVVAHGGGKQTTAVLVLAATGRLDYKTFLFANVGDDSEHPGTLRYLREIAMPYAQAHGITIHELHRVKGEGTKETLYGRLTRPGPSALAIPVRMAPTGIPGQRTCTKDFKIDTLGKWLKANGASAENPATVAVGISADEIGRINNRRAAPYERLAYPLVQMIDGHHDPDTGLDRPLTRRDCEDIIRDGGLPLPGKSACWFCPFHRLNDWAEKRRHDPELFQRAADLEDHLNDYRDLTGRNRVYLSHRLLPLAEAIPPAPDMLPGMDEDDDPHCDNGWCMT